jgi:hypothetical protein
MNWTGKTIYNPQFKLEMTGLFYNKYYTVDCFGSYILNYSLHPKAKNGYICGEFIVQTGKFLPQLAIKKIRIRDVNWRE